MYDVRDLIAEFRDYRLSESPRGAAFADGPAPAEMNYPAMSGGSGSFPPQQSSGPSREERVESLVKGIEDVVASDTWKDNGGSVGAIRENFGTLAVTQTLPNHKLLQQYLDQLSERASAMVRVEVDWLWMPPADVARLLKPARAGAPVEVVREVDPAALGALPANVRHVHAEVTGRNGQTVYVVSGRERSLVTNVTPVVSTATSAFAPTTSNVASGLGLQVKPIAKPDLGFAMVELLASFDELGSPQSVSAGAVAGGIFEAIPATQPAPTTQPAPQPLVLPRSPTTTQPGSASVLSPFSTIGMKVQELRTDIRVPLGRPVLVGGASWDPASSPGTVPQVLLIITVNFTK
jgi:hypothetical protein